MKVILLQKVAGLGGADDVKEVAEGYARNFLFPRHLAVPASARLLGELEVRQRREAKQAEQDLKEQQQLAAKVDGRGIELTEKANAKGQLYAAVSSQKIAEKLQALGLAVDKKQILLKTIKEVGTYPVPVKFRHGLEAEITVIVNARV